jgi:predicted nucleotide-binding protein
MDQVPVNWDRDFIAHPGLPNGMWETQQADIDILSDYGLVQFRDNEHFRLTAAGLTLGDSILENEELTSKGAMANRNMRDRIRSVKPEDVTVEKRDGGVANAVPARFLIDGAREIVIYTSQIPSGLREGDIVVRYLPDGERERYRVLDPGFTRQSGSGAADAVQEHYEIKHERLSSIGIEPEPKSVKEQNVTQVKDPRKVFVVHGRDLKLRDDLFAFLQSIGLSPIEWSQAKKATKKASPYIKEILDAAFGMAQAVVVLLTPDDLAYLRPELLQPRDGPDETEPTGQARPNVLFEAGMALAREPDRTVLVEIGKLRQFTDISGIHLVRLNNSTEKRQDLADALEIAGCPVDLSGRQWHTIGKFINAPNKKAIKR